MGSRLLVVALLLALIIPLPAAGFNFSPSTPKPVPPFALEDGTGKTLSLADFLLDPAEIMSRPGATGRDAGTHREASRR